MLTVNEVLYFVGPFGPGPCTGYDQSLTLSSNRPRALAGLDLREQFVRRRPKSPHRSRLLVELEIVLE